MLRIEDGGCLGPTSPGRSHAAPSTLHPGGGGLAFAFAGGGASCGLARRLYGEDVAHEPVASLGGVFARGALFRGGALCRGGVFTGMGAFGRGDAFLGGGRMYLIDCVSDGFVHNTHLL